LGGNSIEKEEKAKQKKKGKIQGKWMVKMDLARCKEESKGKITCGAIWNFMKIMGTTYVLC
jgi:hypothetical protein